jgi:ankyrin repeat protein
MAMTEAPLPALHAAIWAGDVDSVRALLSTAPCASPGTSRNSSGGGGEDAEDAAARELLEAKDAHGNSALHLAVRVVQPAQRVIVQLLLVRPSLLLRYRCVD